MILAVSRVIRIERLPPVYDCVSWNWKHHEGKLQSIEFFSTSLSNCSLHEAMFDLLKDYEHLGIIISCSPEG